MSAVDAIKTFRAALYAGMVTAISDSNVQVIYGLPGPQQPNDIVSIVGYAAEQDFATLSSSLRTREQTIAQQVLVSVFRPGDQTQQLVAEQRAFDLLIAIEEYTRVTDTTIGGTVRHCFLASHQFDPETDVNSQITTQGRYVTLRATFTAKQRITS